MGATIKEPNTYTAYAKEELKRTGRLARYRVKITPEEQSNLMFETGDRFAKNFSRLFLQRDKMYEKVTLDEKYGFWAWWRLKFRLDDASLVDFNLLGNAPYKELKEAMVDDDLLTLEYYHFIKHLL